MRRCSESTMSSSVSSTQSGDTRPIILCRRNAAKMLIAVVVMFGICYLPVHLLNILRYVQVGLDDKLAIQFALIAHWLCYFNSAINPVIYNFMSEKFQTAFHNVLSCKSSRASRTLYLRSTMRRSQPATMRRSQQQTTMRRSHQRSPSLRHSIAYV